MAEFLQSLPPTTDEVVIFSCVVAHLHIFIKTIKHKTTDGTIVVTITTTS